MRPRVVIVQRHLAHFRRAFFERLAAHDAALSIEVFHSGALEGGAAASLPGVRLRTFRSFAIRGRRGYDLVFQPGVVWELLRHPPEIVVLEGTFGIVSNMLVAALRRLGRRPTLYWVCGWEKPGLGTLRRRLKRALIRRLLALSSGAIAYGSAARDYLLAHGLAPDRIHVAQNTIDVEAILEKGDAWRRRGAALRRTLLPDARRVVVYVGRLSPEKRADLLLEAHAELRAEWEDLGLLIVGDGPLLGELRERVASQGIEGVHFAGSIHDGVEAFFAAGDVFAMPGTGGLALNQAMALGLPLVATVADGTERDLVVPGENGELARPGDPEALCAALRRILDDPGRARRMGERSLEIVRERATLGLMVERFAESLARCGARRRAATSKARAGG